MKIKNQKPTQDIFGHGPKIALLATFCYLHAFLGGLHQGTVLTLNAELKQ